MADVQAKIKENVKENVQERSQENDQLKSQCAHRVPLVLGQKNEGVVEVAGQGRGVRITARLESLMDLQHAGQGRAGAAVGRAHER